MSLFPFALAALEALVPTGHDHGPLAAAIADASRDERTAAALVVVAFRESHAGAELVGDGGHSAGPFHRWCRSSWECARLREDWSFAAVVAREDLEVSERACAREPEAERQAFYLAGRCGVALSQARDRWFLARFLRRMVGRGQS